MISAWDSDAFEDDRIDISPESDWNSLVITYDSVAMLDEGTYKGDGTQDATGWDGIIEYTLRPFDARLATFKEYHWEYKDKLYSLEWTLEYEIYSQMRALNHDIDWTGADDFDDVVDQFGAFASTSRNAYLEPLAIALKELATSNGHTSELELAEFVYAFVGDIQYQFDLNQQGDEAEYPKYPIEMLWDEGGDCEDASILYIALIEFLGYDAMIAVGLVKPNDEEDWGGHAWALVHIAGHGGYGWYGTGLKSDLSFYFVEATNYDDGVSEIGLNPWYDIKDVALYDVE